MGGSSNPLKNPLTYINPMTAVNAFGANNASGGQLFNGGGSASAAAAANPYEAALAEIALRGYSQTDPLRQGLLGQMGEVASGTFNPMKSPTYAPLYSAARSGAEAQYGVAKGNILGSTPRGGGQTEALANLEGVRAADVGAIPGMISSNILNDLLNKAYGTAFGAPQQSMAGLTSASQTYGNAANQSRLAAYGQQSALYGGLGTIGGMGLGTMLGGPIGGKVGAQAGQKVGTGVSGK